MSSFTDSVIEIEGWAVANFTSDSKIQKIEVRDAFNRDTFNDDPVVRSAVTPPAKSAPLGGSGQPGSRC